MTEKDRPWIRLTDAEIAAWKAIPPASEEELEAIRRETPEQSAAAARRIFREALKALYPLGKPFIYSRLRRPPKN